MQRASELQLPLNILRIRKENRILRLRPYIYISCECTSSLTLLCTAEQTWQSTSSASSDCHILIPDQINTAPVH